MVVLWKTVLSFFQKLNIKLPYDSAIPFLSVCPREMKTNVHTKTYLSVFIMLLAIPRLEKQAKYPTIGYLLSKLCICLMDHAYLLKII